MGFKPPVPTGSFQKMEKIITSLSKSRKSVLLVAPISAYQRGRLRTYHKQEAGDGVKLFSRFIQETRPQLVEKPLLEPGNVHRLMVLHVATGAEGEETAYLVDSSNYFFVRGVENSDHPALGRGLGAVQGKWLEADRGANFIVQLRALLREFCKYQASNHLLTDAFVGFASRMQEVYSTNLPGMLTMSQNLALPPGVAERLVDFFYLDVPAEQRVDEEYEANVEALLLGGLDESIFLQGGWKWAAPDQLPAFKSSFTGLAIAFRRKLMGANPGKNVLSDLGAKFDLAAKAVSLDPAAFRAAQRALGGILEMLPSRALPQEALRWFLEGVFVELVGTTDPTEEEQFARIAKGIREGNGSTIAAPKAAVLSDKVRTDFRYKLEKLVGKLFDLLVSGEDDAAVTNKVGELFPDQPDLLADQDLFQKIRSLLKTLAGAGMEEPESQERLKSGARILMELLLKTRVLPYAFSLPVLTMYDLQSWVEGIHSGLALETAGVNGEVDTALADVGRNTQGLISPIAASEDTDAGKLEKLVNGVAPSLLYSQLGALANNSGQLVETARAFQAAYAMMKGLPMSSPGTVVSALRALRGQRTEANKETSTQKSSLGYLSAVLLTRYEVQVKPMLKALEQALTDYEKVVAECAEMAKKAKPEAAEQVEKLAVRAATGVRVKSLAGDIRQLPGIPWDLPQLQRASQLLEPTSPAKEEQAEVGADAVVPAPEGQSPPADLLGSILGKILSENPGAPVEASDAAIEQAIKEATAPFAHTADQAAVEGLLRGYEAINNGIFAAYADRMHETTHIPFCRQVEAMVLGRILVAEGKRCRVAGEGSGLLSMLCDLVQRTGSGSTDVKGEDVKAVELSREESLYKYVDGGFLQDGQGVKTLRDQLHRAAKESFGNITSYISELQGIRYLFDQAPAGSTIHIFNGTSEQLNGYAHQGLSTASHLLSILPLEGVAPPGLMYVAGEVEAGGVFPHAYTCTTALPDLESFRNGQMGIALPPIVTRMGGITGGRGIHHLAVGPDFPLNRVKTKFDKDNKLVVTPDDMATVLPAPYPVLVGYLRGGELGTAGLMHNELANCHAPSGKFINVGAPSGNVEHALNEVFNLEFKANHHLYVLFRLYAACYLLNGGDGKRAWLTPASFGNWFRPNPRDGTRTWDDLDLDTEVHIAPAFFTGSGKTFQFNGDLGVALGHLAAPAVNELLIQKANLGGNPAVPAKALDLLDAEGGTVFSPADGAPGRSVLPAWFIEIIRQFN